MNLTSQIIQRINYWDSEDMEIEIIDIETITILEIIGTISFSDGK